jgi:HAD superfamily hydrolase (TIGR01509 family)
MTNPKVLFFDVGNTLLFPDRARILAPLHARKIDPTMDQWHAVERRTKSEFDAAMSHGKSDHGFWHIFYTHLLDEFQLHDDGVRDELVAATRVSANWGEIRPGTRDVLQRLGQRYRLAVISNADGKIAALLQKNKLADCFQTITDSGLVGYEKPHLAIFQAALQSMNTAAEKTLYVGDVYSVDYAGATAAGMQAVLFDVCGAYRESGKPRVESLEELEMKIESVL